MRKKWIELDKTSTVLTDTYKYVIGWYRHECYGKCLRVSKYKVNGEWIGHFAIIEDDVAEVLDTLQRVSSSEVIETFLR